MSDNEQAQLAPDVTPTPSDANKGPAPNDPDALEARITAAAKEIAKFDEPPKDDIDADAHAEPVDAPEPDEEVKQAEPKSDKSKGKAKGKAAEEPKAAPDDAAKNRNMIRDIAAEWAVARKAKAENDKRAAELAQKQGELEQQFQTAREVAMLMQGNPVKAAEKLAQLAGMRPSEYLQRLQQAYISGEEPQSQQLDAVAQELAQLRAELQREKQQRAEEEQSRAYQQQMVEVHKAETSNLVSLAKANAELFPSLNQINDEAMERRVAHAVAHFLKAGEHVGRYEVLQAVDTLVAEHLRELGIGDTVEARASAAPATRVEKPATGSGNPAKTRNGTASRQIPTNRDAANTSGSRRALSVEERLREAEKVLWNASDDR